MSPPTRREPAFAAPAPSKITTHESDDQDRGYTDRLSQESTTRTRVAVLEDLADVIAQDARRDVEDLMAAGWDHETALAVVAEGWHAVVERGLARVAW